MEKLDELDIELVNVAREVVKKNYDDVNYNHTVSSAVRCSSGKLYYGMNVFSMHGACAEQTAMGSAVANGDKDFVTIVAVRGKDGEEVLPPCGNCRQMLSDYNPNCFVIIETKDGLRKVKAYELLPFSYKFE